MPAVTSVANPHLAARWNAAGFCDSLMPMFTTDHLYSDPAYGARLRACGLDTVGRILNCIEGRVAAWSRSTETLHVPGPDGLPGFYVKRYLFPDWSKRIRGALRGTFFGPHRGRAEFQALNTMRNVGVPAVRPVAYGSRRQAHFLTACFLITEEVPDAENLTTAATAVASGRRRLDKRSRAAWLRGLAEALADMHAKGVSHGNLFWRNVLVREGPAGQPEFFFLDARPMRPWERVAGAPWWLRELAQMYVSARPFTTRTERLRFLRHYLGPGRLSPTLKTQVRQLESVAQTWRGHEQRRIHMNTLFDNWNRQLVREQAGGAGWPA